MPAGKEALALKQFGNKAFSSHEWLDAIDYYNKAIEVYADDPSFYCNKAQVSASPVADVSSRADLFIYRLKSN